MKNYINYQNEIETALKTKKNVSKLFDELINEGNLTEEEKWFLMSYKFNDANLLSALVELKDTKGITSAFNFLAQLLDKDFDPQNVLDIFKIRPDKFDKSEATQKTHEKCDGGNLGMDAAAQTKVFKPYIQILEKLFLRGISPQTILALINKSYTCGFFQGNNLIKIMGYYKAAQEDIHLLIDLLIRLYRAGVDKHSFYIAMNDCGFAFNKVLLKLLVETIELQQQDYQEIKKLKTQMNEIAAVNESLANHFDSLTHTPKESQTTDYFNHQNQLLIQIANQQRETEMRCQAIIELIDRKNNPVHERLSDLTEKNKRLQEQVNELNRKVNMFFQMPMPHHYFGQPYFGPQQTTNTENLYNNFTPFDHPQAYYSNPFLQPTTEHAIPPNASSSTTPSASSTQPSIDELIQFDPIDSQPPYDPRLYGINRSMQQAKNNITPTLLGKKSEDLRSPKT